MGPHDQDDQKHNGQEARNIQAQERAQEPQVEATNRNQQAAQANQQRATQNAADQARTVALSEKAKEAAGKKSAKKKKKADQEAADKDNKKTQDSQQQQADKSHGNQFSNKMGYEAAAEKQLIESISMILGALAIPTYIITRFTGYVVARAILDPTAYGAVGLVELAQKVVKHAKGEPITEEDRRKWQRWTKEAGFASEIASNFVANTIAHAAATTVEVGPLFDGGFSSSIRDAQWARNGTLPFMDAVQAGVKGWWHNVGRNIPVLAEVAKVEKNNQDAEAGEIGINQQADMAARQQAEAARAAQQNRPRGPGQ